MNQHDQIIQVLCRSLGAFGLLLSLTENKTALHIIKERILDLNRAIEYVEDTQKTEQVEADVLKKSGNVDMMREALRELTDAICNGRYEDPAHDRIYRAILEAEQALAAEPVPLVRLTADEVHAIWSYTLLPMQIANAIMDAMERVNGQRGGQATASEHRDYRVKTQAPKRPLPPTTEKS